jgi:6-phosphogluconolactonase (cycloisomerase 2 family)
MRLLLPSLALLGVARLATAGTILYATAATTNGVDGFCVRGDGGLAPTPRTHVATGIEPRRLIIGPNQTLYVVERERVEAFAIKSGGGLKPLGGIRRLSNPRMNPQDAVVSPDGRMLYVPQNGFDRIAAYPLAADGTPAEDFTSCVQGPSSSGFQRLLLDGSLLYASANSLGGHIAVYPLTGDADGRLQLELQPADCHLGKSPSTPTCPISARRKILRPRSFAIDGDHLYVESLFYHRIFAYRLTGGLFEPPVRKKTGEVVSVCLRDAKGDTLTDGPFKWQKPSSKTAAENAYQDVVLDDGTLYGSQFLRGRVDAFRLKDTGELPKGAARTTKEDVRGSPVGVLARGNTLYVAAGEFDRVQAFRLRNGLPDPTPFSETDEQKNSFPNALAIATTTDPCTD